MIGYDFLMCLAFLLGTFLFLHPIFSKSEYPSNGRIYCIVVGIVLISIGFYMENNRNSYKKFRQDYEFKATRNSK